MAFNHLNQKNLAKLLPFFCRKIREREEERNQERTKRKVGKSQGRLVSVHVRFQARNQGQIWKFWTQFLGSGRAWERKKGVKNFGAIWRARAECLESQKGGRFRFAYPNPSLGLAKVKLPQTLTFFFPCKLDGIFMCMFVCAWLKIGTPFGGEIRTCWQPKGRILRYEL